MIPAHIIRKIRRVHIKSRRTVSSIMAGQYRSVFRGSGMEFEEVREYSPGDEVKSIDWKVSARLGKPFVKRFREEREAIVMLLIDMSDSLKFGTFSGQKLETVAETASVLAFSAIKNNDKVGVIFFTDQVEKYIPPKKGSAHIWRVIKEIFTFTPQGRGTDLNAPLEYVAKVLKKRSFVFILSDFLGPADQRALGIARRRHEIIGVNIQDDGALALPKSGILPVRDLETGGVRWVDGAHVETRRAYARIQAGRRAQMRRLFIRSKCDFMELNTRDSVAEALSRYFRQREKRLR
ncbi:MAG: DUF58 domain-containing protein [Desulfobacterales bacterium]|nr:DUF58 domain-containing protein [Desulfobacterales bacterium]